MTKYDYLIRSAWPGQTQDPPSIGRQWLQLVDNLTRIDPVFSNWGIGDAALKDWVPLGEARERMAAIVAHDIWHDDYGKPNAFDGGYKLLARTDLHGGDAAKPTSVSLRVTAGSNWRNEAFINTGGYQIPPDPSIVTYPIFKAALLALIAAWPCAWANACAFKMDYWEASDAPGEEPMPSSIYHLSWMAYLSAERSAKLTPPAGVTWERTPDGGLLLIAAEERFDPTNPLHIQRSRAIVNFMIAQLGDPPEL
jgi:hypothetical protein